MVEKILPYLPTHHRYVEVFGGGASLLFAKSISKDEVYNDLNDGLVNLFRVLKNPALFSTFFVKVACTPYSREDYAFCRDTWRDCAGDSIEYAYRWYVTARQSFGGNFGQSWGPSVSAVGGGVSLTCLRWMKALVNMPTVHKRLINVAIENQDCKVILRRYDAADTLFYCDPPYVHTSRRGGSYAHEMTNKDHKDMIELFHTLKGMIILSGYPNAIYNVLEQCGWGIIKWDVACNIVGRTRGTGLIGNGATDANSGNQRRIECLWANPKAVRTLAESGIDFI